MHQPIATTTQLDLVRAEQAQRRRRAATERTARAVRLANRRRRRPSLPSISDGYLDPWPELDLLDGTAPSR